MTCHLCESPLDDAIVVGTKARYDMPSRRVTCMECGLVQVSPAPTEDEILDYYREDYWKLPRVSLWDGGRIVSPEDGEAYADALRALGAQRANEIVERLEIEPGHRVLELGAGEGLVLRALRDLGIEAAGVEPDEGHREALTSEGFSVYRTIDDVPEGEAFDAVVGYHVLEHFHQPLDVLAKVRAHLAFQGRVLWEVPNTWRPSGPLESHHWQWVHLFDFSPPTLRALLHRAGFVGVHVHERGNLTAVATDLGHEARPYVPHGALGGDWVAAYLSEHQRRHEPDTDLASLSVPTEDEGGKRERRLLKRIQPILAKNLDTYQGAMRLLRTVARHLKESAWEDTSPPLHGSEWLDGFGTGVAHERLKTSQLLIHLANAMHLAGDAPVRSNDEETAA